MLEFTRFTLLIGESTTHPVWLAPAVGRSLMGWNKDGIWETDWVYLQTEDVGQRVDSGERNRVCCGGLLEHMTGPESGIKRRSPRNGTSHGEPKLPPAGQSRSA